MHRITQKICSMTLEDILKMPQQNSLNSSNHNPAYSSDNASSTDLFKADQMDEFEEVVCEEIVETCLE